MKKLLIGGHDSLFRSELMKLFESEGFYIQEASRPNEVLKCVLDQKFDAIIFNFSFEERGSVQALFAIRVLDSKAPVIIIADEEDTMSSVQSVVHEAFRYLHNSTDYNEIKEAVDDAIKRRLMSGSAMNEKVC